MIARRFHSLWVALAVALWSLAGGAGSLLSPSWSTYVGGISEPDGVTALAPMGEGGCFAAGFLGEGYLSGGSFDSIGGRDGMVMRILPDGTLAWVSPVGSDSNDKVTGLAGSPEQLYAVGFSETSSSLEGGSVAFIASLIPRTGEPNWPIRRMGDYEGTNAFTAVALDGKGGVYAVGYASTRGLGQGLPAPSPGGESDGSRLAGDVDAVAAKFDSMGRLLWWRYIGGENFDRALSCTFREGALYVGGETRSPGWGGGGAVDPRQASGFITKLGEDGSLKWNLVLAGSGEVSVRALAARRGLLFAGGESSVEAFSPANGVGLRNRHSGGKDGFVLCLREDETGYGAEWTRFIGGPGDDRVNALALGGQGEILVGGEVRSACLSPSDGSRYGGDLDGFVALLPESGGTPSWASYQGGSHADTTQALAFSREGNLFSGGKTLSEGWIQGGFCPVWEKDEMWGPITDCGYVKMWTPPQPPRIVSGPDSVRVMDGEPAVFQVAVEGSRPLSYTWYWNGRVYAHSPVLRLDAADISMDGSTFFCVVSNQVAAARSAEALLTVTNRPPRITADLEDLTVVEGDPARFTLEVDGGSAPLFYTWYQAGTPIPDAHDPSYTLSGTTLADQGTLFSCTVSNLSGSVTSRDARLNVRGRQPEIVGQPADLSVRAGRSATFSVEARTGSAPLSYLWYRGGEAIPGAEGPRYTVESVSLEEDGTLFSCLVTNLYGSVSSRQATLTVKPYATGRLTVSIAPSEAVAFGARWSVDGGETWRSVGEEVTLREGSYRVVFSPVKGYQTPAAIEGAPVREDELTRLEAIYTVAVVTPPALRKIEGERATLTITPPGGCFFWGVTEQLPPGVVPLCVDAPAGSWSWSAESGNLLFSGAGSQPATLSYTVGIASNGLYEVKGEFLSYPLMEREGVAGEKFFEKRGLFREIAGSSVQIRVVPPTDREVFVWVLEERIPAGLAVVACSGPGATWNASDRTLTWMMLGGEGALCAYSVTGEPGSYELGGRITFGGAYEPILGSSLVTLSAVDSLLPPPLITGFRVGRERIDLRFTTVESGVYTVETNGTLSSEGWGRVMEIEGRFPDQAVTLPKLSGRGFIRVVGKKKEVRNE